MLCCACSTEDTANQSWHQIAFPTIIYTEAQKKNTINIIQCNSVAVMNWKKKQIGIFFFALYHNQSNYSVNTGIGVQCTGMNKATPCYILCYPEIIIIIIRVLEGFRTEDQYLNKTVPFSYVQSDKISLIWQSRAGTGTLPVFWTLVVLWLYVFKDAIKYSNYKVYNQHSSSEDSATALYSIREMHTFFLS